jgi:hypothetical protein
MTFEDTLRRRTDTACEVVQQTNALTMCGPALPAPEDDSQDGAGR